LHQSDSLPTCKILAFYHLYGLEVKVYLYRTRPRTRPRLDGVREEMVEIKQTKVVYTERERRKPRSRSRSV